LLGLYNSMVRVDAMSSIDRLARTHRTRTRLSSRSLRFVPAPCVRQTCSLGSAGVPTASVSASMATAFLRACKAPMRFRLARAIIERVW
jgi:hypothetical protein